MSSKKTEFDYALDSIINALRKKEVLLPEEIEELCKDLTKKEKEKIISKILSLGYKKNEDRIEFSEDAKPTETVEDKDVLSCLIKPEYVNTESDFIQVGTQFYKGIIATGFPTQVSENWLGELTQEKSNIDFSIFIEPSSVRAMEIYLNNQLKKVENDLYVYEQRGITNASLINRKKELLEQLNHIIKGTYKLYKMSLYIASKGANKESTNMLGTRIMNMLHSKGIEAKYSTKYNEQMLKSIIPTATNHLQARQVLIPGPAAAASFPFSSSFYDVNEKEGVLLGFNSNKIPIAKSIWDLPKYVGAIIGSTGSGKSYSAKALILNDRMVNGTKIFILDPEDEYTQMCGLINDSQIIRLDRKSKNIPNLLDMMGGSLSEKLLSLPKIFEVLLEGVTPLQKPILEQSLIKTYSLKRITTENEKSWKKTPPRLSDLIKVLRKEAKKCHEERMRSEYEVLISKLSRYTEGVFKFMDSNSKPMDTDKDFVVFEFKQMPDEVRPVLMLTLLEYIKNRFRQTKDKKMLVLDEAWRILKNKTESDYIESFARTFRKSNGALLLITQSVAELRDSPEGKAYLANSAFCYVFKTEGVVIDETAKLFGLNTSEKNIISNAKQGEGVLIWDRSHYKIHVKVDPETHKLITTNPQEILNMKKKSA